MTRIARTWILSCFVLLGCRMAAAQDLLLQPRADELLIGPLPFQRVVQGVPLAGRASLFFSIASLSDVLQIDVRGIADLADLQSKIGVIIDTIDLPKDPCNLVARIWGKRITVEETSAILELNGDVDAFVCLPIFGAQRVVNQPFDLLLPFSLRLADPQTFAVELGEPRVKLGGTFAGITNGLLVIAGVNVNERVKASLQAAIDPKLLRQKLPEDLAGLNPTLRRAEFLSNSGALAASAEMSLQFEAEGIVKLLGLFLSRPQQANPQ